MTTFNRIPSSNRSVVLIVEDDEILRDLLVEVVSDTGAEVRAVMSADAGLKAFQESSEVALILTDVITPGVLNGWDLVSAVRQVDASIPIIVTSGYCHHVCPELPKNACFLQKPWSIDQLCTMVEARLKKG